MIEKNNLKSRQALTGICLLSFTLFLDLGMVSNALPTIQKALSANNIELQWVILAFMLGLCAWIIIIGRLGDLFGVRRIFYINLVIFSLASLGAGLSQNIHSLIFFRALQGLGAAIAPLSLPLIAHNCSKSLRPNAVISFFIVSGIGISLGPLMGGLLVDFFHWRWVFLIHLPIVVLGLLISFRAVAETEKVGEQPSFGLIGLVLWLVGLSLIVLSLMQAPLFKWSPFGIISGIFTGLVALMVFVIFELDKANPLLDFPLLNNRIFISAALTCLIFGAFIATALFLDPLYLQQILSLKASISGLWLFAVFASTALLAPIANSMASRYGVKISTVAILFFVIISACLHFYFSPSINIFLLLMAFITFGISWGFLNTIPILIAANHVDQKNIGAIMRTLWIFLSLGASIVFAGVGALFRWQEKQYFLYHLADTRIALNEGLYSLIERLLNNPPHIRQVLNELSSHFFESIYPLFQSAFMHSFRLTLFFLGVLCTVVLLIILLITKKPRQRKPE